MGKDAKAKEDLVLSAIQWGAENAEKLKASGKVQLAAEFDNVRTAFASGDLSDEDAAKYGRVLIEAILVGAAASKNLKVIGIATLLTSLDAPTWAGPIAGNLLKNAFEQGPAISSSLEETARWINEKAKSVKV